jgi:hypothetical protein
MRGRHWQLGCQLEVSQGWEVATGGSTGWSQLSEYEGVMSWLLPPEGVSPEAEEHLLLEVSMKQCDWGHKSVHASDT